MLNIPELAMNPNRKVTTVCYGEKQEWDDREEAQAYFLEAMMNSDGAEHDRYSASTFSFRTDLTTAPTKMMTRRTSHEAL